MRASVYLFDFAAQEMELLSVSTDRETALSTGAHLRVDLSQLPELYAAGRVYLTHDLLTAIEQPPASDRLIAEGVRAHLSVPLLPAGELIGCANPYCRRRQPRHGARIR
jgi:GAF domain-containing protein